MYCEKCGTQIFENTRICPNCGKAIPGEHQNVTEASTYEGPMGAPTPVLVWGILGLSFSCTMIFSILGLIFSIISLRKAGKYRAFTGGASSTQVTIGRRLSIAGLIVSIFFILMFMILLVNA